MTTMRRRFKGILAAAAMTTTMLASTVSAADAINVEGKVNAQGIEADVNMATAIDMEAGAVSTTGTVTVSGTAITFADYFDSEKIMLQVPLLPAVLSYNYKAEPTGAITQYIPAELLSAVNEYASLLWKASFTTPDLDALQANITAALGEILGSVQPTQIEPKDCLVGGTTVSCEGYSITLTGEMLGEAFDAILTASDGNGNSIGSSLASCSKIYKGFSLLTGSQSESMAQAADLIDTVLSGGADMIASLGPVELTLYGNEAPAEINIKSGESTLTLQFTGAPETPWTNIIISADGTEVAAYTCDITMTGGRRIALSAQGTEVASLNTERKNGGNGTYSTLSVQGSEVGALDVEFDGTSGKIDVISGGSVLGSAQFAQDENGGLTASVSAGAQTLAAISVSGRSYTLDVNAIPSLPTITGELLDNGFTVVCGDKANFTVTFGETDGVVVPTGDVLNLESASAEDLQALVSILSSIAGALTGSVAAQ